MWANAQHDGLPAEYRWRPLFNAAKFGWCPLLECRTVTLPRCETCWDLQGCPKLTKQSQPLVGQSSPYYKDMWKRYCCLTNFFRLLIHGLVAKIQPDKVVRWCRDCDFLRHFCVLYFQTCILNSPSGHTMCRSMVDIHSATTEIRRGKKRRKKKETTGKNIMACPIP